MAGFGRQTLGTSPFGAVNTSQGPPYGAPGGWRYLLCELDGSDGSETIVHTEFPIKKPTLSRALSTPHQITGTLDVPTADLFREDGSPLLRRWKSTIYAEDPNGKIWVGGMLADYTIDGPVLALDVAGFTAYPVDEPYDDEVEFVQTDPLDVVRHIWQWLQVRPGGNLNLRVDDTATPVRVGEPREEGEGADQSAAPLQLNWWSTDNLGSKIDELAKSAPFDYLEHHTWGDGDNILHRLELGYPTIGRRLDNLSFTLGVNVRKMPAETLDGEDVVTGVRVLGAGEGRDRIIGVAESAPSDSVRRIKTVVDKLITSNDEATVRARQELARYTNDRPGAGITELIITDSPEAPFGSYDVGDEIPYVGDHDWGEVDVWVKIVKLTIQPDTSDDIIATVVRTDSLGS